MKQIRILPCTLSAIITLGLSLCASQAVTPAKNYETGFKSISKISTELYNALDGKKRGQLLPIPVLLQNYPTPYVEPGIYSDGTKVWQAVSLSSGLVDFLNCLSHAKAMEAGDRSAYSRYVEGLRNTSAGMPAAQAVANNMDWSFDTMNHQVSHFNQMAGALVAIEMAHHYLGHYKKYESKMKDAQGNPVPINSLVTPQEWREAVLKGAKNALDCGLGVDGLKVVLETMDKKETRPTWSIYFVPNEANLAKVKKDLTKLEKDFFLSGK